MPKKRRSEASRRGYNARTLGLNFQRFNNKLLKRIGGYGHYIFGSGEDHSLGEILEVGADSKVRDEGGEGTSIIKLHEKEEAKRGKELIIIHKMKGAKNFWDSYSHIRTPLLFQMLIICCLYYNKELQPVDKSVKKFFDIIERGLVKDD